MRLSHTTVIPGPYQSFAALIELTRSGVLLQDCLDSARRVLCGFTLAAGLGITLAFTLGMQRSCSSLVMPVLELLRPIPPIAWIPVAMTVFGLGDPSADFVIFIGSFYPILTNTLLGVTSVASDHLDAAKLLGASSWRILKQIIWPSSLPSIFAGLRVGLGFAWMCVVAAEMVAASSGLGYEIQLNRQLLRMDRVVAGMMAIGLIGYMMNRAMQYLERACLPWVHLKQISDENLEESLPVKEAPTAGGQKQAGGALVQVKNLHFGYNQERPQIVDFNIKIMPGEVLCILGGSGCGKTTILRLLAGLLLPQQGGIAITGGVADRAPVADELAPNHKAKLTMVFQGSALFPWQTVLENVCFALQSKGVPSDQQKELATAALARVGLSHKATQFPAALSGGQKQRVALARALAYAPDLLLLDEPFAALDSQTRESLQDDLSRLLAEQNVTAVLVTHDIREAIFLSDRVIMLGKSGATILDQVAVEEPRPRSSEYRYTREFSEMRTRLWKSLHEN